MVARWILDSCKATGPGDVQRYVRVKKKFMGKIKRIFVRSKAGRYAVVCGRGVLERLSSEIGGLGRFSSVHVVTSAKVWAAVGKKVRRGLGAMRAQVHKFDEDRKSTRLNSSHANISYAVFCLKKKKKNKSCTQLERPIITAI